jgi:hypothetical protein
MSRETAKALVCAAIYLGLKLAALEAIRSAARRPARARIAAAAR